MRGGDETDAPPGGWLVVACFHTLWSAGSIKVMPNIVELVPFYQDMINFLTVRADCHGMVPISKALKIKVFPTFVVLRGGKEIERIEGTERCVEKLVRILNVNLKEDDKVAREKHRHRLRLENALEMGKDVCAIRVEEEQKQTQIDWTWDNEQCGVSMRIGHYGRCAELHPDGEDKRSVNRDRGAEWKKIFLKAAQVGKDIEGIKGTVGLLPNTGVHNWTLRWNHEPSREGKGDGFGVCSDACERFGPMTSPLFGGADSGVSLALYADGNLYHNGNVIQFIKVNEKLLKFYLL
jgi:hypothetical protein